MNFKGFYTPSGVNIVGDYDEDINTLKNAMEIRMSPNQNGQVELRMFPFNFPIFDKPTDIPLTLFSTLFPLDEDNCSKFKGFESYYEQIVSAAKSDLALPKKSGLILPN